MSSASIRDRDRERGDLRSQVQAAVALARPSTIVPFVTLVTLLGAGVGGAVPGERLVIVWLANILAVSFAFMVNDIEDAEDDSLVPAKAVRNPISAGRITPRVGYGAAMLVGIAGMALYALVGTWPSVFGALCLALGVLYSWRRVRLKAIPVADLVSHTLMLAALQFLCAYSAFEPRGISWIVPCLGVVAASAYGQLVNQVRDLDGDREAGVYHTTARIGRGVAQALMLGTAAMAVGALPIMIWLGILPIWVVATFAVLAVVLILVVNRRASRPRSASAASKVDFNHMDRTLHVPVLTSGTLALLAWLIVR